MEQNSISDLSGNEIKLQNQKKKTTQGRKINEAIKVLCLQNRHTQLRLQINLDEWFQYFLSFFNQVINIFPSQTTGGEHGRKITSPFIRELRRPSVSTHQGKKTSDADTDADAGTAPENTSLEKKRGLYLIPPPPYALYLRNKARG